MLTLADTRSGVTTRRASALLEVKTPPPAPNAKRVCLVPPLPEASSTLTLSSEKNQIKNRSQQCKSSNIESTQC